MSRKDHTRSAVVKFSGSLGILKFSSTLFAFVFPIFFFWNYLQNKTSRLYHIPSLLQAPRYTLRKNWESANTKIKLEETGESGGGGACNHFFKRPVPVYQLLVYPLIGQIWQIISTLSKRVVPVTQRELACGVHGREIEDSTITSVLNECLLYFQHMGALRKEQKTCLVNLVRGKDVFVILPTDFGLAW